MNAAVSLTMCVFNRLAWKMLPLYVFAQFLGSFLAAGTVYAIYYGKATQPVQAHKALSTYTVHHCCISIGNCASKNPCLLNIVPICRGYTWLLRRKPDSNWSKGHSWYFCYLPCTIPLLAGWIH